MIVEIKTIIDYIKSMDLNKLDPIDIKKIFDDKLKFILTKTNSIKFYVHTYERNHFKIYRLIKYEQKPLNFNQLIYPPIELCKLNRCNMINEQVFYGSNSHITIINECNFEVNDSFIYTEWYINKAINLISFGLTEEIHNNRKEFGERINYIDETDKVSYFNNIEIAKLFTYNTIDFPNIYKITSAIVSFFLDFEYFHGIFYPTVAGKYLSDNIALKKICIDNEIIKPKYIYWGKVKDETVINGQKVMNMEWFDFANSINIDGIIDWKNRMPQISIPPQKSVHYIINNGLFTCYDENNKELTFN